MAGRRVGHDGDMLTDDERALLDSAPRAILVTIAPDGRPRPVPICYVVDAEAALIYSPIDDKPKRVDDPLALARVRDIGADARVAVLVDRWDEDWTRLAWLRGDGRASVVEPGAPEHAGIVAALRARYPQYATHRLEERPIIRMTLDRSRSWGALE